MNIEVAAVRVRIPLVRPFTSAAGHWSARESWLVRLRDADGRCGVGEAALDPLAGLAAMTALEAHVRERVARIEQTSGAHGSAEGSAPVVTLEDPDALDGAARAAQAAFAGALLDGGWIVPGDGSSSGRPMPGVAVPVNATIDAVATDQAVEDARRAVEAGFRTLKLKAPAAESAGQLAGRIAVVRAAVGDGVGLRIDANGAWSIAEARIRIDALASLGLAYVEQPVATVPELAELRRGSPVPVAADEVVASPAAASAVLDALAADVLVVKPARVGGPLAALRIADLAAARGVPVVVSTLLETGVGVGTALRVAAALPDGPAHGLATTGFLASDLLSTPLVVRDGAMEVPARGTWPGPDDAAVRGFTVAAAGSPW